MAIVAHLALDDLEVMEAPLGWQLAGLQYTASGYGRKIPTTRMARIPGDKRWRRIYVCHYSNAFTAYMVLGKDWVVVF